MILKSYFKYSVNNNTVLYGEPYIKKEILYKKNNFIY